MNRRQFLGAQLCGIFALFALRLEEFKKWWAEFLGVAREPFFGIDRSQFPDRLSGVADSYEYRLRSYPQFIFMNPADHSQLLMELS